MSMGEGNRDTTALRAHNIARVLSEIRRRGQTARVDLSKSLELSPTTITNVVGELLDQGLVQETDALAISGRGRPRVQLMLNPSARFVAGAKLNTDAVTVAILDFAGKVLADTTVKVPGPPVAPAALVDALEQAFAAVLRKVRLSPSDLAGIGVGVPGFVERETGLCHWSPVLGQTPLNLRTLIEDRLGCPVEVDNDANLATLAELWFGHGRDERDFLVVTVEHGVGLGVVIGGKLYRGGRGLGAEFGHTKVQIDGALCRCGQRGCLEAYVADFALVREARTALQGRDLPESTVDLLALLSQQAKSGDPMPASIYRRAGRMLGLGLANLLNIFDPPMIILAGERINNQTLLEAGIRQAIDENAIRTGRPPARLAFHRWGDGLWARGAGALALEALSGTLMTSPGNERLAG